MVISIDKYYHFNYNKKQFKITFGGIMEGKDKLKEMLKVAKTIMSNAKLNKNANVLISRDVYNEYNVLNYKAELLKMFSRFRSSRYFCKSIEINSITTNYEFGEIKSSIISDPVGNHTGNIIDEQIFARSFSKSLIDLSYKLTYEESIYLVKTFMEKMSEEHIAEILHISKPTLQKYKKSCLIKMWIELKQYKDR